MTIRESTDAFEAWLRTHLAGEIVEDDLARKHKTMRKDAFRFLRATYWRWADSILDLLPDLADAPQVLAVGDIHLENYGTWRDREGRLVWGVNDFDEAAVMPYALDIVRLAASAVLCPSTTANLETICAAILSGYAKGVDKPEAIVLERNETWLASYLESGHIARAAFARYYSPKKHLGKALRSKVPPPGFADALDAARPDASVALLFWPRTAGGGSLGRPRWIGYGEWRGGAVVREAKAMIPSAWVRNGNRGPLSLRCLEIATGRYRSPDPWLTMRGTILVRRKSPDNRKLEMERIDRSGDRQISLQVLEMMGSDLAAVHLGTGDPARAVKRDLKRRGKPVWLASAVTTACDFVSADHAEWVATRPKHRGRRSGRPH